MEVLLWYLLAVNVIAFIMFNLDKWYASTGGWRVSESTLLLTCLLGGAPGGYLGMRYARHKTKKPLFAVGLPAMGIIQLFIIFRISF
ncbi:DUF1294 domain-containing protein [Desulforamulus ruminis]|uniref:DUF1294 domain-containing protein n=1 Tax=Desulforamulus ruminis (strain ATCC 23193 / DSM 2154 / NCIMB 8452 / DL) TaxID=696281 RepID=F6DR81_DESRL|nr:DUF1294 domain-containing protein [Desulforamulus ruminis]AEG60916.1 protein of unknown function DUF1294 [Desulforamulus ruminis DSM 2154]